MTMPLSTSFVGKPMRQGLMLGYAAHDEDAIMAGAKRLSETIAAAP